MKYFSKVTKETIKDYVERYCPHCRKRTMQKRTFYNPDSPKEGEVWECLRCKECVDFVEEES